MIDKNKLAFKGTHGLWTYKKDKFFHGICIGNEIIGRFGSLYGKFSEENEANSHLASAAPEAIEFIADILESCTRDIPNMDIPEIIHRAETILKKAYNF